jgi:hypothetical protein
MFGRRKQQSFAEVKETMRPTPDADGVSRVFSKELWNDPKVGDVLRKFGYNPDDARNVLPTAEDYIALFSAAKERLIARVEAFNREMLVHYSYCRAAPFLVIDRSIWDAEHGAFLYAQMNLIGFDDWNIVMLAGDERTKAVTGLPGHPGTEPAISRLMTNKVIDWKRRYELALEAFGVTATGGRGITREQYQAEHDAIRKEIVDIVGRMKPIIRAELLRVQG